jgi:hypothetical protein
LKVNIKCRGSINRPVDGISRWFHIYYCEAENGAIQEIEDEDLIEDGVYDLPDKDWTFDENEDYGEDLIDEQDILGRPVA